MFSMDELPPYRLNEDASIEEESNDDEEMDESCEYSEDEFEAIVCEICKTAENEEYLLLCENKDCKYAYHTFCIGLGLKVPEGIWFCEDCEVFFKPKIGEKKIIIEEDSE